MSTAVEPIDSQIDPVPPKPDKEEKEEEDKRPPNNLRWYLDNEPMYRVLQKRWGLFSLIGFLIYAYHFISLIVGLNMYCHWTRFLGCDTSVFDTMAPVYFSKADLGKSDKLTEFNAWMTKSQNYGATVTKEALQESTDMFDMAIMVVTWFHMLEWIRQTLFLTIVLVGMNWLKAFNCLAINVPFGFIASIIAFIAGFTAEEGCGVVQASRVGYLQLQICTFFLYILFCFAPILTMVVCNKLFKPNDADNVSGILLYDSWVHKQYACEEEDDDD